MGYSSRFSIDTNVLIDLHRGNVLKEFFMLPYTFIAPDVIIEELLEPSGLYSTSLGLQRGELSGEGVSEVIFLTGQHPNIAVTDFFALVLAKSMDIPLLTGDSRLRSLAEKHNLVVHGTLWVLDEMIVKYILKPIEASRALRNMLDRGSRLPLVECQTRFRVWER